MKKILLLAFVCCTANAVAQNTRNEQFKKLFKAHDTAAVKLLLDQWEKSHPEDPEFYTAAFNFYFDASKKEIVSIESNAPKEESLQLTDSTGAVKGYLYSSLHFEAAPLRKGLQYINTGISKFPDRLDIRFGKCYVLGAMGDYENFTKEIITVIQYSLINHNQWLWTENKKLDDAQNYMLNAVYSYMKQLYETEDDSLLKNMIAIGKATLPHYPGKIEILSITAVALMLTADYDQAITYLKQAEQLNPKDGIVLNNIAEAYRRKGDTANAVKYYELAAKFGDADTKQQATEMIKTLKKQ